jgi:protein-tyrosine phosphatase
MVNTYRVCFVCMGNICRSPMAEWVLRKHVADAGLADTVDVRSGGTAGWHLGEHADHRTVYALRVNGYECDHVANMFEASWFRDLDLVIPMDKQDLRHLTELASSAEDRAKIRLLREFDPAAGADLEVADPYNGTSANFAATLRLVEAAMPGVLAEIRTALGIEAVTVGRLVAP